MPFISFKEQMIKLFKPPNSDKKFNIAFYIDDTKVEAPPAETIPEATGKHTVESYF